MNRLISVLIICLANNFVHGQSKPNYEQLVVDYFFAEIFPEKFENVTTIGFTGRTDSVRDTYTLAIMLRCEQWTEEEKYLFLEEYPVLIKEINVKKFGYRVKNTKAKRNKLVIHVLPAFQINDKVFTLISVYKRLHFCRIFSL